MIDLDFEKRLRAAAHAPVDAVPVPALPQSLRRLRSGAAQRPAARWWWAVAAAAAVTLTVTTDGGRAAVAFAVEQTVKVFSIDPDTGKRIAVSTISMQEALATTAFPVVEPRGFPPGSRLVSVQRMGDPETGRPSVLFQYAVAGRRFEILENALIPTGAASSVVRGSSVQSEPQDATVKVTSPAVMRFSAGRTQITVSTYAAALTHAQVDAMREAMVAAAR